MGEHNIFPFNPSGVSHYITPDFQSHYFAQATNKNYNRIIKTSINTFVLHAE